MTQRMNDNLLKAMFMIIVFIVLIVRSWFLDGSAQGSRQTGGFNAVSTGNRDTLNVIHAKFDDTGIAPEGVQRTTR